MKTRMLLALSMILAADGLPLEAQVNPYVPQQPDPRTRRALRERAVAHAGPGSRAFVEALGDEAVAAIAACSPNAARRLAEFHDSGALGKLPRPHDLLWAIGQPGHGDEVALWSIRHARELTDVDAFNAFLATPLEYVLALKPLETGAAEFRARRLAQTAVQAPPRFDIDQKPLLLYAAGVLGIIGLLVWWKHRQSGL